MSSRHTKVVDHDEFVTAVAVEFVALSFLFLVIHSMRKTGNDFETVPNAIELNK